jgi:hypothetical protein
VTTVVNLKVSYNAILLLTALATLPVVNYDSAGQS